MSKPAIIAILALVCSSTTALSQSNWENTMGNAVAHIGLDSYSETNPIKDALD